MMDQEMRISRGVYVHYVLLLVVSALLHGFGYNLGPHCSTVGTAWLIHSLLTKFIAELLPCTLSSHHVSLIDFVMPLALFVMAIGDFTAKISSPPADPICRSRER